MPEFDNMNKTKTNILPTAAPPKVINDGENSQSNWRNLSEDNETGVDFEQHWKNRINDIVLYIIGLSEYLLERHFGK